MKVALVALLSVWVLVEVGGSVVAAPEQSQRPGEMSPPNVWVQNRGAGEAIPVQLVETTRPLPVEVVRAAGNMQPLPVKVSRQQWEYAQIRIGATQNALTELNTAGAEGWETTGVTLPSPNGVLVVVKRPR